MIDWINLGANSLWILGCAVALAALSYASWEASIRKEKLSASLRKPGIQSTLNLGGLLFSLGLAATSSALLERALWLVLAVAFMAQLTAAILRSRARARSEEETSPSP